MDQIPFYSPPITQAEIAAVTEALASGWLTMGHKVLEFEQAFARYTGSEHAVAVSSCTAALHLALLVAGIGPQDEVITTPLTFCATAEAIEYCGATPVLADIQPDTLNIAPEAIAARVTARTKAILPVHYAGQACDMDEIRALAAEHGLAVIEDAAHAAGSSYKGVRVGNLGEATAFSFYATKNLTTGEGGMVTTNNAAWADKMRLLRLHGMNRDAWQRYSAAGSWYYEVTDLGFKYNTTSFQAAMGCVQLARLEELNQRRREICAQYDAAFAQVEAVQPLALRPEREHSGHLYVLQIDNQKSALNRDALIEALKAEGIGTSVHFIPLHYHPYYAQHHGWKRRDYPVAEEAFERILSLPLYPDMTDAQVECVCRQVRAGVEGRLAK